MLRAMRAFRAQCCLHAPLLYAPEPSQVIIESSELDFLQRNV